MEEQEAPLEDVHEQIHHHAEHAREKWIMGVALSTALLAALAAIASLLSGDNVNEAMFNQMESIDAWNQYQADGIKSTELGTRLLFAERNTPEENAKFKKKIAEYEVNRKDLRINADKKQNAAQGQMERHHKIAKSVTWSQIAIAVSAIAVLTRQKWFWVVGMGFGVAGLYFLLWGVFT
jgi:hypothetical protein